MCEVLSLKNLLDVDELTRYIDNDLGRLKDNDLKEYNKLVNIFNQSHASASIKTTDKGSSLENVVNFLFEKIGLFEVYANVRTSTHEIDQILTLNTKGKLFSSLKAINIPPDGFLGECKNYKNNIPSTWIGKFCSLLMVTNHRLGILFSYNGLTGNSWTEANGLTKKIYLLKENESDKIKIVNFTYEDLKSIGLGKNFFNILNFKLNELKYGTDISSYIIKHEAEDEFGTI